jgi:hypothetical protein
MYSRRVAGYMTVTCSEDASQPRKTSSKLAYSLGSESVSREVHEVHTIPRFALRVCEPPRDITEAETGVRLGM